MSTLPLRNSGIRVLCAIVISLVLAMNCTLLFAQSSNSRKITRDRESTPDRDEHIFLRRSHINTRFHDRTKIPRQLRTRFANRFIIQFSDTIDESWINQLNDAGITLVSYIPENAYIITMQEDEPIDWSQFPFVTWAGPYEAYYKLSDEIIAKIEEQQDVQPTEADQEFPEIISLNVLFFPGEEEKAIEQIENLFGEVVSTVKQGSLSMATVLIPSYHLEQVAQIDGVKWIESEPRLVKHNDLSRNLTGVTATLLSHATLTGRGVIVNVNDTGVDHTHPAFALNPLLPTSYPDNNTRIRYYSWGSGEQGDTDAHGTHVSGSILGNGALSNTIISAPGSTYPYSVKGMAPDAELVLMEIFNGGGIAHTTILNTAYTQGARISSNSWGYNGFFGPLAQYDSNAAIYDAGVRDALNMTSGDQGLTILFAAGNSGGGTTNGLGGKPNTVASPGTAKNVITVGAYELNRNADNHNNAASNDNVGEVSYFSSRGPVEPGTDGEFGRFKPDIVAPGVYVLSTHSSQSEDSDSSPTSWDYKAGNVDSGPRYEFMSGTSMACPVTAGVSSLIYQYYRDLGKAISPALLKALLINGARSLSAIYDFNTKADIIYQGWGGINLQNSIDGPNGIGDANDLLVFDQGDLGLLETGSTATTIIAVNDLSRPLRITLVWTDPPGDPAADITLVNNLDLLVTAPDGKVYRGNNFPKGSTWTAPDGEHDFINNVENVYIDSALIGAYTISVKGTSINADACTQTPGTIDQDFALVISGSMGFEPQSFALITVNKPVCNIGEFITVSVADNDLAGSGSCTVTVSSETETGEQMTLLESATDGVFNGTIQVDSGPVQAGDGKIQVVQGEDIVFTFIDQDDGQGNFNTPRTATSRSNTPPVFSGLQSLTEEESQITISWTPAVDQESPIIYRIFRRKAGESFDFFRPYMETTDFSFTDTIVSAIVTYHYLVRAVDKYNLSDSNTVELSGSPDDSVPPSFEGLKDISAGDSTIQLVWSPAYDPSYPVSYNIYRATTSGAQDFNTPLHTLADLTKYTDNTVTNGIMYFYVVRAIDALGNEDNNTVELFAQPDTPPSNVIFVDKDRLGGGNGTSWLQAYNNLSLAINDAQSGGNQIIWVAEGTYYFNDTIVIPNGVKIYGGFAGDEVSETAHETRNPLEHKTIFKNNSFFAESTVQLGENALLNGVYVSKYYSVFFDGVAITTVDSGAEINQCVIYDSKWGIHNKSTGSGTKIYNCVFLNNEIGVVMDQPTVSLINNTFQFNDTAVSILTSGAATIKNNIFYKCDDYAVKNTGSSTTISLNYNNYFENGDNYLNLSPGNNELYDDPIFISEDLDFHLGKGSPCINAGEALINDYDIEGQTRSSAAIDIGADEVEVVDTPSTAMLFEILNDPIGMVKITATVSDPNGDLCRMKLEHKDLLDRNAPYFNSICDGPISSVLGSPPDITNDMDYQIGSKTPLQTSVANTLTFYWNSGKDVYFKYHVPAPRKEYNIKLRLTVNDGKADDTAPPQPSLYLDNRPVMLTEPEFTIGTTNTVHCKAIEQASQFWFQASTSSAFSSIFAQSGWIPTSSHTFTGLAQGTQYYFRTKARALKTTSAQWIQTKWNEFNTNSLTDIDVITQPLSAILNSDFAWKNELILDRSFETVTGNWTTGESINASSDSLIVQKNGTWASDGAYSAKIANNTESLNYPNDYGYVRQSINLTNVSALLFDVKYEALNPTGLKVKGQLRVGSKILWEKAISGEHLNQEVDVSDITGAQNVEFRLVFLDYVLSTTTSDLFSMHIDNMRAKGLQLYDNDGGVMVTPVISPTTFVRWETLQYSTSNITDATDVTIDVLDSSGNVLLADVLSTTDLKSNGITGPIKLRATLYSSDPAQTPALDEWSITYIEKENEAIDSEYSTSKTSYQDFDTDNDGMPNQYETYYSTHLADPSAIPLDPAVADGSVDSDNDSKSNFWEYITGTDPTDPADFIEMTSNITYTDGVTAVVLTIPSKDARWYEAFSSECDTSVPVWTQLGETIRGNGLNITFTDTDEDLEIPYEKKIYFIRIKRDN
ncbi:MAG: S8 family serine peptidase [Candidatus Auribacterota bacterium]